MNTRGTMLGLRIGLIAFVIVLIGGCGSMKPRHQEPMSDELVERILETHNERVGQIERLWARVSVRIKGSDSQGKGFEEQGEGHLQVIRPSKVSLTIGKLGETYFAYGSTADQYWMFDRSDSDHRVALFGAVDNLSIERAGEIGLSVHPGDLIMALGIESIDAESVLESRWEDDFVVITVASRGGGWGTVEWWFDPSSGLPGLVRSLDEAGAMLVDSELSRYKELLEGYKRGSGIRVPGKVEIRSGEGGVKAGEFVRIELSEPSQRSIKSMVYDFERLSRRYRIHETVDLDLDLDQPSP